MKFLGQVRGLENYECVRWNLLMMLSSIVEGRTWCCVGEEIVGGGRCGSGFMDLFIRSSTSMAKS